MKNTLQSAMTGALAGAAATIPMSAVMYASKRAGLMGEYPPVVITDTALESAGVHPDKDTEEVAAGIAHLGFGAAAGAIFGILRSELDLPGSSELQGILFGLGVYTVSYAGWIPAMNILPEPDHDRPGRQPSMAAAHVVYGAVLGGLVGRLASR